jgi:tetratricopeptide (TPR) repeat protein/spermidine synthase
LAQSKSAAPAPAKRIPRGLPEATAFASSFCVMVIELVAGRIISRHLGSSLYTWTSVIGVVLAGLAIGNAIGGRLADRRPAIPTLSLLFLASSASCIVVLVANAFVGEWVLLWTLSWPVRIAIHVGLVFLIPSVILGMISPVAAKMAVEASTHTGRAIGNVSAWGVVGSILGTFATGFVLVAAFGTTRVVWGVAAALALISLFFGMFGRKSHPALAWGAVLLALGAFAAGPTAAMRGASETVGFREKTSPNDVYVDESQYSHIRVAREAENPNRLYLHLDKLVHSAIEVGKPLELQYGYERIYGALTRHMAAGRDSIRTLTLGGGGYVLPRFLQTLYPKSVTEVVEIDPGVTEAAYAAFDLSKESGLVIVHEDARAFLESLSEKEAIGEQASRPYDFIYLDAVNDYSVPYQLTTLECLKLVDGVLAPDGAYMMNLIDVFSQGRFLGTMIHTMEEIFPEVRIFAEGRPPSEQPDVRNTYILVGTKKSWDSAPVIASFDPRYGISELSAVEREDLRARAPKRPLTDDWAPIENLLAPVVRMSSREIAAAMIVDRAEAMLQEGRPEDAIRAAKQALELHAANPNVRRVYANALVAAGDVAGSVEQYQELLHIRPNLTGARVQLASTMARLGRPEEGIQEIREAIRRDPNHAQAHFVLGILLEQVQRPDEAIAAYAETVRLEPRNLDARNNLGIALARAGRVVEAKKVFEEILTIDAKFAKARQNLQRLESNPQG